MCRASVTALGGQAQADRGSGGGDVDGVFEPLSPGGPAQVVAASGVGGGLEVHAVGPVAVAGAVDRGDVVGHALAAGIVILRLHRARYRCRGAAVRAFGGGVGHRVCAHHDRTGQGRDRQGRQDLGEAEPGGRPDANAVCRGVDKCRIIFAAVSCSFSDGRPGWLPGCCWIRLLYTRSRPGRHHPPATAGPRHCRPVSREGERACWCQRWRRLTHA